MQLSPITPVGADDSVSAITSSSEPEVGVLVSPLVDVSSNLTTDVLRTESLLPSVEGLLQDMLWAPVAPRSPDVDDHHAIRCLGGGWLGKVRSSRSGRLTPSVH